jgi:hypothetical protein
LKKLHNFVDVFLVQKSSRSKAESEIKKKIKKRKSQIICAERRSLIAADDVARWKQRHESCVAVERKILGSIAIPHHRP